MRSSPWVASSILLTLAIASSSAGAETLRGRVIDRTSGEPVAGAVVIVSGDGGVEETGATDGDGRYSVEVAPGRYRLAFMYGDSRVDGRITVKPGERTTLDARLKITPSETIVLEHTRAPAVMPRPRSSFTARKQPPYSDAAITRDAWTRAWLLLDVDRTGVVTRVKFLKRPGYDLEDIAIAEGFKLSFEPARDEHDRPVATLVVWPIEWVARSWLILHAEAVTTMPDRLGPHGRSAAELVPCRGSGPWQFTNLIQAYKGYRDCSRPDLTAASREPWIPRPQ